MAPLGGREFHILKSDEADGASPASEILPDIATCEGCLAELFDPADRRFGYPFINCTHCGPRYSIVLDTPYDRDRTTMRRFRMCPRCQEEYDSPSDRRFHAQPNACPDCGPQLAFVEGNGAPSARRADALEKAACAIEQGRVVAVKGIGGFHLFADARNTSAIEALRERKHRRAKPFAVMMPGLGQTGAHCLVSEIEAAWLRSPAAPIVLLKRLPGCSLPEILAPGNAWLGVMLPYSPLHHLLMRRLGFPVIATSGNLGDEPICIENQEALERLSGIADAFLLHDRPIERAVDDSLVRLVAGGQMILRRSRGYVPAPVECGPGGPPMLAYGGDLKGTLAVSSGERIWLSQHLGDLETAASQEAFRKHLAAFSAICRTTPEILVCDEHPGYHSTRIALESDKPVRRVQHHFAHFAACLAENQIAKTERSLGVVWDGTGFGRDGTVWGGEFLLGNIEGFERFAWLRPFPLPGAEKAVRDPRFAALGCLRVCGIDVEETMLVGVLSREERRVASLQMDRGLNAPLTSSAGRLFDAVAALCGVCWKNEFEGQAAMRLEAVAESAADGEGESAAAVAVRPGEPIDWKPVIEQVLNDLRDGRTPPAVARRFHLGMASMIVEVARGSGCRIVALTGGCFQNRLLSELAIEKLQSAGFLPVWHRLTPPNDGGLALGQAVAAAAFERTHAEKGE
jgi:hydrogenase maturation protein HypF